MKRSADRDRRLNTDSSDGQIYDGYERSGAAYDRNRNTAYNNYDQYYNDYGQDPYANNYYNDQYGAGYGNAEDEERAMRARNLAREAQYKELRAQQDELRRLREEGAKGGR
jgi:hypothetical protein